MKSRLRGMNSLQIAGTLTCCTGPNQLVLAKNWLALLGQANLHLLPLKGQHCCEDYQSISWVYNEVYKKLDLLAGKQESLKLMGNCVDASSPSEACPETRS